MKKILILFGYMVLLILLVGCSRNITLLNGTLKFKKEDSKTLPMKKINFSIKETVTQVDQYFSFNVAGRLIRSLDELVELNEAPYRAKIGLGSFTEEYFNDKILLVVAFIHSSSEKEINVANIELDNGNEIIVILFIIKRIIEAIVFVVCTLSKGIIGF